MKSSIEHFVPVDLLRQLVQARSENPPGNVNRCATVVSNFLEKEGIHYHILESKEGIKNICAYLKGSNSKFKKGKTLLFNGHMDTIPAGEGWNFDPFAAEVQNGYMYGRGTTDMKAGLAASLATLAKLKRKGCPFAGDIILTAVGDEEYHGKYGTKWLLANGLTADMAICCEPTNLELCLGNRGLLMIDVHVKGKASHGGRPSLGINAISLANKIIDELNKLDFTKNQDPNFLDSEGSLSVVGIHGGDRINVIPDHCVFYLDRRLIPNENCEDAILQIEKAITSATGIIPGRGYDKNASIFLISEPWHEPFWMPRDNPFVAQCIEAYISFFGTEPVIEGKSAGTDASHLVSMGKIPTIIFGPGNYRESHTTDEKVELAQIMHAIDYYIYLVEKILQPEVVIS